MAAEVDVGGTGLLAEKDTDSDDFRSDGLLCIDKETG